MLRKEDFVEIQALAKQGVYQRDVAAQLGVHPKTVSRALKRGAAPAGPRRDRWLKLRPYAEAIHGLLAEGVWNAKVILREIQARGYAGSYTTLKGYVRPQRALRPSRATVRFETPPGRQLQSDWGQVVVRIAGVETEVHFIVTTLGYSRIDAGSAARSRPAPGVYVGSPSSTSPSSAAISESPSKDSSDRT